MDKSDFKDKKILIMGLGLNGGGLEAAKFFYKLGGKITVTDLQSEEILKPTIEQLKSCPEIEYHLGHHLESDFSNTDIVIKNPGVPPTSKFLEIASKSGATITSDLEVFLNLATPKKIIAVTGTKGKSTTTTFISQILSSLEIENILAGNIGKSPLNTLGYEKNKYVVIELSSFQIDDLGKKMPYFDTIAFTNIFPDHLNRYGTFNKYQESKLRLINYLKPDGTIVYPKNNFPQIKHLDSQTAVQFDDSFKINLENDTPQNILNFNAALLVVSSTTQFAVDKILPKINTLTPPRFRNQTIRTIKNISFINDSTATNPTVTVGTLKNYNSTESVVIVGGSDKNLDLLILSRFINEKQFHVVLLDSPVGKKLSSHIRKDLIISNCSQFEKAIEDAYDFVKNINGKFVILSPAAASFGMFLNEFDRGEQFNSLVSKLQ